MKPSTQRAGIAAALVIAGLAAAFTAIGGANTPTNPLQVSMTALRESGGAFNGRMEVVVTNAGANTVRVPKWQLPASYLDSEVFQLTRNGTPVDYVGKLVKRPLPSAADFAVLRPGQAQRVVVDLAAAYDLADSGDYTITYAKPLQYASLSGGAQLKTAWGAPMVLQSAPLRLVKTSVQRKPATAPGTQDLLGSVPFPSRSRNTFQGTRPCFRRDGCGTTGGVQATYVACDASRTDLSRQAIAAARLYTENAKGYLNAGTTGERYTWWFGTFLAGRYNSAKQNFAAIDTAMDLNAGQITIHCDCDPEYASAYAYVYPDDPYKIYVCNAFWAAPMTGTDSKAGTLVHEMSHFTVVADTNDWVYGQSGAHSLASSNPDRTSGNRAVSPIVLGNADSHEYFAENTPTRN